MLTEISIQGLGRMSVASPIAHLHRPSQGLLLVLSKASSYPELRSLPMQRASSRGCVQWIWLTLSKSSARSILDRTATRFSKQERPPAPVVASSFSPMTDASSSRQSCPRSWFWSSRFYLSCISIWRRTPTRCSPASMVATQSRWKITRKSTWYWWETRCASTTRMTYLVSMTWKEVHTADLSRAEPRHARRLKTRISFPTSVTYRK